MTATPTIIKPTVTTRTPAPTGSGFLLEDPFAWANDATYVTIPLVPLPSEALRALLRRSAELVARVKYELDRDDEARRAVTAPAVGPQPKHPGTQALEQLQSWLALPLDDIVAVVGLSPSTRQFWRNNPSAPVRPAKAGRLLRFRTAVGLLVGDIGLDRARHLLHSEGWLTPLDEAQLVALEARVREQLSPGPLTAPPALAALTPEQLLAAVKPHTGEAAQRRLETPRDAASAAPAQEDDAG
ncbi:hypothetical protein [Pedococcus bigeumensis]|uniref:hypothetical protein n=1 Tax=Pedococcus bigeumensis TaxID=433644 RepID=UPI002FE7DBDB